MSNPKILSINKITLGNTHNSCIQLVFFIVIILIIIIIITIDSDAVSMFVNVVILSYCFT